MNLIKTSSITMSSMEIAELCDKRHDHVMRDIRKMLAELNIDTPQFWGVYQAENGQSYECFNLPRRECDILISGYNIKYRAAIVDRWQELESKLMPAIPKTYAAALQLAADQARQIEEQEKALAIAAPKVDFYDAVAGSKDCIDIGKAAKTLAIKGYGRNNLFEFLRSKSILQKDNQPYQKYVDSGYFRIIESKWIDSGGDTHINFKTVVYQKGLDFIRRMIEKEQK